ncbi:MAG: type II secretion system GspH family protein [Anaerohalosphaeraceae bacterium]|nr:type II secretion system GspH family protein [Anaerohalosphaeraceae bacterium]
MAKNNNKAFTLVELLVVISIIALLMGILLPSLSVAREQGRCVVCKSNLKNIGLALRLYIDEFEGKMPSADPYPGSYGQKSQHWFMNSALMDNLDLNVGKDANGVPTGTGREHSVLTCPTHRKPMMTKDLSPDYPAQQREYALSYMANGTLGVSNKCFASGEYRHEREYKKPREAMMFCDGNGTMQTQGTVLYGGCPKSNFEYRHREKTNAVFLDQHIESLKEDDIPFCDRLDDRRFGAFWYAKR